MFRQQLPIQPQYGNPIITAKQQQIPSSSIPSSAASTTPSTNRQQHLTQTTSLVLNPNQDKSIKFDFEPKIENDAAAIRVLRTWGLYAPSQQVDFESLEGRPRAWQWRGTLMYWALLPFAIAGAVLLARRRRLLLPLAATAVTVTLVAATTYGQQRFRIAAEPAILVSAAVALTALGRRVRSSATAAAHPDAAEVAR